MALTILQEKQIKDLLCSKIDSKLKKYSRETAYMPFLVSLIQDSEKVAAYSFIHSIATTLGMSIYEEVSKIIASPSCKECFRNYGVGGVISKEQKSVIDKIVADLRNKTRKANLSLEIKEVLNAPTTNGKFQKSGQIADFYMLKNSKEYFFEIKTVKPNIDVFEKSKIKLLEWIARRRKPVEVFLAFPYNPYYPNKYSRFTEQGIMDHPKDLLVGDEYWDFLGGNGTFNQTLKVFDEVGKIYKEKIQAKFKQIAEEKYKQKQNEIFV